MPVDFRWSPHCVFATLAMLEPHDVAAAGGGALNWRGETAEGDELEITEADLREHGHPLHTNEAGVGIYAIKDRENRIRRFEVDHRAELVHVENVDEPMPLGQFVTQALRVRPDGTPICSFSEALYAQRLACDEAGRDGELHAQDIRGFGDAARARGDDVQAGMLDIIASGLKDEKSGMDMLRALVGVRRPLKETHQVFATLDESGIPLAAWHELKDMPQFGIEQVRGLFRHLMSEQIGDFPIEHVARIEAPLEAAPILEAAFQGQAEFVGEEDPFEPRNIIPGYRTSTVKRFKVEGLDAILFSDMRATYAYVFPTPPAPENEPAAPGFR